MLVEPRHFHTDSLGVADVIDDLVDDIVHEERVAPSMRRIGAALQWDRGDEFAQVVRYEHTVGPLRNAGFVIAPSALLNWTIHERAVRCAESLLSGAAGVSVDVNFAPNVYEMSPFYLAVIGLLPDFVDLFLKHGAQLDVPCNAAYSPYHMLLPMEAVFELLGCRGKIQWTPTQQYVYELIFTLCCCSVEHKKALITVSHILRALPVPVTQKAISIYAREGRIIELAILLYVDAISDLGIFKSLKDEYFALRESVITKISLSPEEGPSSIVGEEVMKSVQLLLEIFYRTNFSMLGFETGRAVLEKRIKNAGFRLTNLQNLDDVHESDEEATAVAKVIKPMVDLRQDVFGAGSSILTTALKPTSMENCQLRKVCTRKLYTPIVARSQVMKATHEGPQLLSCSLRRSWPVLASAFRRIVRV